MKRMTLALLSLTLLCMGTAHALGNPVGHQHRFVENLGNDAKRLVKILKKKTPEFRQLAELYDTGVKYLLKCTDFSDENTWADRVYECQPEMNGAFSSLFKVSDLAELNQHLFGRGEWAVMIQNRHSIDMICQHTDYRRPTRSWHDIGQDW